MDISIFIFVPTGTGASLGIVGIPMFLFPILFFYGKFYWSKYQQNKEDTFALIKIIFAIILIVVMSISLIEVILADLFLFFQLFNSNINVYEPDILNMSVESILFFISQIYSTQIGNPFFSHILGMLSGMILFFYLKSKNDQFFYNKSRNLENKNFSSNILSSIF